MNKRLEIQTVFQNKRKSGRNKLLAGTSEIHDEKLAAGFQKL